MLEPPYVRNAPLLLVKAGGDPRVVELGFGEVTLEVRSPDASARVDLVGTARALATAWNYHDPVVDALRALVAAPTDKSAIGQAQQVLAALSAPLEAS